MKKVVIIIILVIFIFIGFIMFTDDNENEVEDVPTYKCDYLCKISSIDDETLEETVTNVYLTVDDNNDVIKAIYQSLTITSYPESYNNLLASFYDFYSGIKGIDTNIVVNNNTVIGTITYDYLLIDELEIKKELGDILDEASILLKDELPISYNDYLKEQLEGYQCIKKELSK